MESDILTVIQAPPITTIESVLFMVAHRRVELPPGGPAGRKDAPTYSIITAAPVIQFVWRPEDIDGIMLCASPPGRSARELGPNWAGLASSAVLLRS